MNTLEDVISFPFEDSFDKLSFERLDRSLSDFVFLSDFSKSEYVNKIILCPELRSMLIDSLLVDPLDPRDSFMVALSNLKYNGDIDSLVRMLSWQHNNILALTDQCKDLDRTLLKLDDFRVKVAKLTRECNLLRERNAALSFNIKKLKQNGFSPSKSKKGSY